MKNTQWTLAALTCFFSLHWIGAPHASAETLAPNECVEIQGPSHAVRGFNPSALSPNSDFPFLTVQIGATGNYYSSQKPKLEQARRLMETVLNSEALKEKILAHTWKGKLQFSDNQGKSNQEIYESIRRAVEKKFNAHEFQAEFNSTLYYSRKNVVGYTYIGDPWIRTNTKYFNPYSAADVAGHLTHEWLHLLGYLHNQTFDASVPYAVGDMVAEIAAQLSL